MVWTILNLESRIMHYIHVLVPPWLKNRPYTLVCVCKVCRSHCPGLAWHCVSDHSAPVTLAGWSTGGRHGDPKQQSCIQYVWFVRTGMRDLHVLVCVILPCLALCSTTVGFLDAPQSKEEDLKGFLQDIFRSFLCVNDFMNHFLQYFHSLNKWCCGPGWDPIFDNLRISCHERGWKWETVLFMSWLCKV